MNGLAKGWEDEEKQKGEGWNKSPIKAARMTATILSSWLESEKELLALEKEFRRIRPKKRTH